MSRNGKGEMKLNKIIDRVKSENTKINPDAKGIQIGCNILASLFPDVKIKKAFFQSLNPGNNDTWRLFLITEEDEAIVLPINPNCPIDLINKDGMIDEMKEFIELNAKQKAKVNEALKKQAEDYAGYLKEITPPEKTKKKKGLKRIK